MTGPVVVKVGGSLLDWPLLKTRLPEWLAQQSPALNVLICGGGKLADAIRQADEHFSLGEESSHWLCIEALSLSARLLAAILSDLPLVTNTVDLLHRRDEQRSGCVVFDPRQFLLEVEPQAAGAHLPHDWTVTSDSIAARVAEVLNADELVLLKSADSPIASLTELAAQGYVDRHFTSFDFTTRPLRLRQPSVFTRYSHAHARRRQSRVQHIAGVRTEM